VHNSVMFAFFPGLSIIFVASEDGLLFFIFALFEYSCFCSGSALANYLLHSVLFVAIRQVRCRVSSLSSIRLEYLHFIPPEFPLSPTDKFLIE